jgi:hypothetical protein
MGACIVHIFSSWGASNNCWFSLLDGKCGHIAMTRQEGAPIIFLFFITPSSAEEVFTKLKCEKGIHRGSLCIVKALFRSYCHAWILISIYRDSLTKKLARLG